MCPKFDGAIVAMIVLVTAAIAFLASTPWIDLALVTVAVLGVAVAGALAKTAYAVVARRQRSRARRDAQ